MLLLVKEDYCISDLQEGLLCLKQAHYNLDELKSSKICCWKVSLDCDRADAELCIPLALTTVHSHIGRRPQTS